MKVIDLFCGIGGFSYGFQQADFEIFASIDISESAISNYKKNFNHKNIICADLNNLLPEEFDKKYNKDKEKIDIIIGGPPCQGYSIAGKRNITDPRNRLYLYYFKYIEYFKPKVFVMENVIGILSMKDDNNNKIIDNIIKIIEKDYNYNIMKLYASDFEVPQNRRRVIIIGFRKELNIIPTYIEPVINKRIPVKTILLPKEQIDSKYFLSERAITSIYTKKIVEKNRGNGFGAQFLDLDKPSYTIPARYWKDGYDALVKYSHTDIRRLTILEIKRIQTFPDDFILEGSKKDIITQLGNSIPCKFAYHIAKYIKNKFI